MPAPPASDLAANDEPSRLDALLLIGGSVGTIGFVAWLLLLLIGALS